MKTEHANPTAGRRLLVWGASLLALTMGTVSAQVVDRLRDPTSDPQYYANAAFQIDRQVAAMFQRMRLSVPPQADDFTYLRRLYLITAGRVPSYKEVVDFMESDDPEKRVKLIDQLLEEEGYVSTMTNWANDLLRMVDNAPSNNRVSLGNYVLWVREAIANDMPYNEFVRSMIGARGFGWKEGNGAVGYYIRDKGMPLDNMANTMRIFAGTHFECAQCHDSPNGEWEQMQFYELAAFTHGQPGKLNSIHNPVRSKIPRDDRQTNWARTVNALGDQFHFNSLGGGGSGQIPLPNSYQYRDGKPGERVAARSPFQPNVRMSARRNSNDGRERFAEWLTSEDNERFNSVIVNRMWKRVMGIGVYEPVDTYVAASDTIYPPLMHTLVKTMQEVNYNLKDFQKVLLLTRTFNFDTNPTEAEVLANHYPFNGRQVTRMTAEQIWDSLLVLAVGEVDSLPKKYISPWFTVRGGPLNGERLVGKKSLFEIAEDIEQMETPEEYEAYARELLELMEAEIAGEDSGSSSESESMMMMDSEMMEMSSEARGYRGPRRASEMNQPARAGSFLHNFGQSDRLTPDPGTTEANLSQVLEILNGEVQNLIVQNKNAAIYKLLDGKSPEEQINILFKSILTRPPSEMEMELMLGEFEHDPKHAASNILAALIASNEFLFIL